MTLIDLSDSGGGATGHKVGDDDQLPKQDKGESRP